MNEKGKQYIQSHVDMLARNKDTFKTETKGVLDLLNQEIKQWAIHLGLDPDSEEFMATWLLACMALHMLRVSLLGTEEESREIGGEYILRALWRLEVVGLWHKQFPSSEKNLKLFEE